MLVIMPIGRFPLGKIILDTIDASSKIIDPRIIDVGIKNLWSSPTNILEKCGAINPINPIVPTYETEIAVIMDDKINIIVLKLSVSIPKLLALSSPANNAVSDQEYL